MRLYFVHDLNVLVTDFDLLDQQPQQLPLGGQVRLRQIGRYLLRERLEVRHHLTPSRRTLLGLHLRRIRLFLARQPLLDPLRPRLELHLVQIVRRVQIQQPRQLTLQPRDRTPQRPRRGLPRRGGLLATLQFLTQTLRVPQQGADVGPHRVFQGGVHGGVAAPGFAAVTIFVGSQTAIVYVTLAALPAASATVGRAATTTHQQTAQQELAAAPLGALPLAVVRQAPGHGVEQLLADQRGHRDHGVFGRRGGSCHLVVPGERRSPTGRPPAGRPRFQPGFAIVRRAVIGGIAQDGPHRSPVPTRPPLVRRHALRGQALHHRAQRQAFQPDPGKQLPDHAGLFGHDVIAGLTAAIVLAHVVIAVGRVAQDADLALLGAEAPAAACAFQDFRPFILGDHALHLDQQIAFGRSFGEGMVEKDDLDVLPPELLQQHGLIDKFTRQPIRRVDIETLDAASMNQVAQAFQGGAAQAGAAVAVVEETQLGIEPVAGGGQVVFQGGDLTVDGGLVGLALRADPRIQRDPLCVVHNSSSWGEGRSQQTLVWRSAAGRGRSWWSGAGAAWSQQLVGEGPELFVAAGAAVNALERPCWCSAFALHDPLAEEDGRRRVAAPTAVFRAAEATSEGGQYGKTPALLQRRL